MGETRKSPGGRYAVVPARAFADRRLWPEHLRALIWLGTRDALFGLIEAPLADVAAGLQVAQFTAARFLRELRGLGYLREGSPGPLMHGIVRRGTMPGGFTVAVHLLFEEVAS